MVIERQFDGIRDFSEGLAKMQNEKDQKRINKKDKLKHQKAIRDSMPSHIMTAAEWEYATDDYKELREKPKMNVTQFKEYRNIIDESISGKENENNVDKTSESTLTNDQIKEFKEAEEEAEDSYDFTVLADEIADAGDKEWAKKVYMKVESMAEKANHFRNLADSILKNFGDKEWVRKVYEKAEGKAESHRWCHDVTDLADSIHKNLGDKEWATKLYKKVETKAEDFDEFIGLADGIHQNLGDTEWATKLYKKAESRPEADCDDFISHEDYIRNELGDEEWANKVFKKAEDKAESFDDLERLAERKAFHEFGTDEPKTEWAEKICKIAEENAEDISAYESLAEWIRNTLGNEKWAKLIDQKAKELEDDN